MLSAMLDLVSQDVKESMEFHDTLFDDDGDQQWSNEDNKDAKVKDAVCCMAQCGGTNPLICFHDPYSEGHG